MFKNVCIVGDFNFPNIDWIGSWSGEEDSTFIESLRDSFLVQMVKKPTRFREGQTPHILDLVIVNNDSLVSDIEHLCPIGKSDHEVLSCKLYIDIGDAQIVDNIKLNLKKGNYDKIRYDVGKKDWEELNKLSVEECWNVIKNTILSAMENNIPKIINKQNKRPKQKWINTKCKRAIKSKYKLYKRYLITKEGVDYQRYIKVRNKCNSIIKQAKREYEQKVAKDCKNNVKCFWKYVQEKLKVNNGVSPLKTEKGDIVVTDKDKANILNDFFSTVFTKENHKDMPSISEAERSQGFTLADIQVTSEAVGKALKNLNPNKAHGPDSIPSRVLKELHNELSLPLTILFNKSISEGKIPGDWKKANVVAIFKKGTRNNPGNYRPVSLTCVVCKVLESLIRDVLVNYMSSSKLYAACQHGFRQKHSCMTQLLEVMEDITKMLDNKESIDLVH
jgi:hypothetical protein